MPTGYTAGPAYKQVIVESVSTLNYQAVVRDKLGQRSTVALDVLGYKGDYPSPGEKWLLCRSSGSWLFSHILGYRPYVAANSISATKYVETLGDGTTTSFPISHNLLTKDVIVQVFAQNSPYGQVLPNADGPLLSIEHTSTDGITLTFSSAPVANAYRVVILSA